MRIGCCNGLKKWLTEMLLEFFLKLKERYALIVCAIKSERTTNANILDASNAYLMVGEEDSCVRCATLGTGTIFLDVAAVRSKFAKIVAAIESS